MAETGTDIEKAKALLERDELVAIPTETVYGLAGNAMSANAASKIFQAKNRPTFNPLILHSDRIEKIAEFIETIPEKAYRLAEKFWPGPLTLLLKKKDITPDIVTAGLPTAAVRIPNHPLTLSLLQSLDFPVAAPSANPFGYISPTRAEHVNSQLGDRIAYILDGGPCQIGIESTIIGFENGRPTVFRLGGLSVEDIEEVIGRVSVTAHSSSRPQSPGMLKSHYSPGKKMLIGNIPELIRTQKNDRSFGVISFRDSYPEIEPERQVILSESGNMREAAMRLFEGLRYLDKLSIKVIFAELLPEQGLGRAINDRLRRAAAK